MTRTGYRLGVDIGTTFAAAAVAREDGRTEMLGLGNRAMQVPSVLFLKPDDQFLVGDAAENRAAAEPDRAAREFKRRIGDPVPILVAGRPFSAEALTARMLAWVVGMATEREGAPPQSVAVSHPANWGQFKLDAYRQAFRLADLRDVLTCTEPESAAVTYASRHPGDAGRILVIYDLGGGTFDAAVLRADGDGFMSLGEPEGIERLGGVDFDEAIFRHAVSAAGLTGIDADDQDALLGLQRLRRDCVAAKETLSVDTEAVIPVAVAGRQDSVRLTRGELEDLLRPALEDTLGATRRVLESAGVGPEDVSAIVLTGGSSRIPLVTELLAGAFGRPLAVDTHPKHAVAEGAARVAYRQSHSPQPRRGPTAPIVRADPEPSAPAVRPSTARTSAPTVTAPPPETGRGTAGAAGPARTVSRPPGTHGGGVPRPGSASSRVLWPLFGGLVLLAVVLAFAAPAQTAPGGSKHVDFGNPHPFGDASAVTLSVFFLHVPGTKVNDKFSWSNEAILLAGPVHAIASATSGTTTRLILIPTRAWFTTIPGGALIASPFFVGAYVSSSVRNIRRRRRTGANQVVGLALLGAVVGLALDDASWVLGKRLLHSYIAGGVVLLALAAFVVLSLAVGRHRPSSPRSA